MARDDRRDFDRGDRYGDNNFDRGGYPDNNFDKNYDSSSYNVRGGRNYPPRDEYQQEAPRSRNNAPMQPPRQYENGGYRPIEDVQLQERDNQPKAREPQPMPQYQQPVNNISGASNILVSYPKTYQEVKQLIDSLRNKQAVIIDIIKLEPDDAQRVLDFMSGANYALCGSMQRLNTTMFVFTPGGVSIKIPYEIDKKK